MFRSSAYLINEFVPQFCRSRDTFGDLNIVVFVGLYTLSSYAINIDAVSLFTNSSFLFLATLNLYCINILYQFE